MSKNAKIQESGAVQPRTLAVAISVALLAGLVALLFHRPERKAPRAEMPSVPSELCRTNLVLAEGRLCQPGRTTPFSGVMVEHYPDGALRSRSTVTNGLLHGISEGWYTNAQIQVSEHFKEGVSHGLRTKWYTSGAKQSEANIANGQLSGTFRKWHENGMLSEQVEFVAGQPEGISLAYFPSGCLKTRVVMKGGKPAERKIWKDGENKG